MVGQSCSNRSRIRLMGVGCSVVRAAYNSHNHSRADDVKCRGSNRTYDSFQNEVVFLATMHPDYHSYTSLDPSRTEIIDLAQAGIDTNCFPHKIAFDKSFYGTLRNFDMRASSFACKDYTSQKRFINELVTHLLYQKEDHDVFESRSKSFVKRYIFEGVPLAEYGQIGEALVTAMASVHGGDESRAVWNRVYSRFIRAIR